MEYITQKFILNNDNRIEIRLDNPLELPGNEWLCGLKEFSLEPKWSLAEDDIIVNFQDGTSTIIKPVNTLGANNIDTVLEELFPKRRLKRSKDLLGDITGYNKRKKQEEEKKAEDEKKTEEEKKAEEEKKKEDEQKKLEEDKKREEDKKKKEEKKRAEERKREEEKKLEEEKKAEEDKKKEEEKKRAEERKREEEKKLEEEKKREEDKKKEEDKKREEKEKQKKEDEERKREEDKKQEEKEKQKKEDEERKREEDKKQEEKKKEEDKKKEEEMKKEEEKKREEKKTEEEQTTVPEMGHAEKLVDEKKKKPDLVSSLTGTQARQEQKQQQIAAQAPKAEALLGTATLDKYNKESDANKIGSPYYKAVPVAPDLKPLQDIVAGITGSKKEQNEQKQTETDQKTTEPDQKTTETKEKEAEVQQKIPANPYQKEVPKAPDISILTDYVSTKGKAVEKSSEEAQKNVEEAKKSVETTQKTVKEVQKTIDEAQKSIEEALDPDKVTVYHISKSKEPLNFISEAQLDENKLSGLKSITFTKVDNRFTVTFDSRLIRSLKLSHGFAQAIGFTQSTTILNNQIASEKPSVNPFYSHICIRMHGVLRPFNKDHDAEIAVIPVEKGKNVHSFYPQPLYFKVEKTFIDTISLEFRDFLDNPIVCDRANGYFVLQFVKRS